MPMNWTMQIAVAVAAVAVASTACTTAGRPMDRGVAFYNNGQYLAAIEAFSAVVRQAPNSATAYNNRAVARVRNGDVIGAIEDYTRAIALTPYDAELYFNRGNAFIAAGHHGPALADFNRAVQISPTYARAWFNRGTAHSLLGRPDAALQDWRHAIDMESDPWAKSAMRRSAGLDAALAFAPVGQPTIGSSMPLDTEVSLPPRVVVPDAFPSASIATPYATVIDSRALAVRAISRELDGDRSGALADLRAAVTMETDPARRESIANLLRLLDTPR